MDPKEPPPHLFYGIHVFGEFYGVSPSKLDDLEYLEKILADGITQSLATLCSMQRKQFDPCGVTLLALLSESHASIHTYPNEGAVFVDAFTCGTECQPQKIVEHLSRMLEPTKSHIQTIQRGNL